MPIVLAIDYGLARIGLAISFVGLAEPLKVVKNDLIDNDLPIGPQALKEIQAIIQEEKVEKIVIGVSESKMAKKTIEFFNHLKSLLDLEIIMIDETLSSYEVEQRLRELPKKIRRQAIDHYAAALILENYLDLC
jgi:putative transcription antitermination factor YqgF